jgi:hypothetical protein
MSQRDNSARKELIGLFQKLIRLEASQLNGTMSQVDAVLLQETKEKIRSIGVNLHDARTLAAGMVAKQYLGSSHS